jgi:hypothetical protein
MGSDPVFSKNMRAWQTGVRAAPPRQRDEFDSRSPHQQREERKLSRVS